jgi:2-polyprenyl-3-methyl-5-hydroxy-6-metoxy-1,4-benzoquinol methylase/ribosomal protein S27E
MPETKSEVDRIRPKDLHDKAVALRKECGERFFGDYHERFVDTRCPACGKDGKTVFFKYGFTHRKCAACATLYCSPRPTEDMLIEYYSTSKATCFWTDLLVSTGCERKVLQYGPRAEQLVEILKQDTDFNSARAVDLGAGSGAFALALSRTGFFDKVMAVDFSDKCCDACEKLGLETRHGSVDVLSDVQVNFISMNDMVEHLFDPMQFLSQCYDVLDPNGYISIACPNGEGFDFQVMQEKTVNITPPEHLNYFNSDSLALLLESVGFEMVSICTPGILDVQIVARAFRDGLIDLKDNLWLRERIIQDDAEFLAAFQKFLQQNKWSSHMVAIAKKSQ